MEKNNRNGVGVFYGVIGVATLVVAVIGATFAWFTASAGSNATDITAGSKTANTLTFTTVSNLKDNLIPVDDGDSKFPSFIGVDSAKCKDLNQNDICSVYQFTIGNTGTIAQQIGVTFTPKVNTFENLWYAVYEGTDFTKTPVVAKTKLVNGSVAPIVFSELSQVLGAAGTANASKTYSLVLWIKEANTNQTTADAGKSFTAGINVGTGTAKPDGTFEGGITGVLGTAGTP